MKRWSEDELSILREHYGRNSGVLRRLLLGRTWKQIKQQAYTLRLTEQREEKRWSDEEVSVLREFYTWSTEGDLLLRLPGRTWREITHKGYRIGLERTRVWPSQINVFSKEEIAYMAGIVDADGMISISVSNGSWSGLIGGNNVSERLIDWLADKFQVRKYLVKRKEKHRKQWGVHVYRRVDVIAILEQILPYLIVKKRRAELVLEFCRLKMNNPSGVPTKRDFEILEEVRRLNKIHSEG